MSNTAIFWPLIAQTALIYVIYFMVSKRRIGVIKSGEAQPSDFRIPTIEPEGSSSVARNLINQFELPFLFYAVCIALYLVNGVNDATILLAWAFVISRIAHSWIHITSNRIRHRRPMFIVGFLINGILWLWLAWKLI